MASIWEKTFGKRNAKKNVARELSEKIIEYKNDYGYETIAEAVVQVGNSYEFAKDMDHAAPIYAVWRSAKELNVLDVAGEPLLNRINMKTNLMITMIRVQL